MVFSTHHEGFFVIYTVQHLNDVVMGQYTTPSCHEVTMSHVVIYFHVAQLLYLALPMVYDYLNWSLICAFTNNIIFILDVCNRFRAVVSSYNKQCQIRNGIYSSVLYNPEMKWFLRVVIAHYDALRQREWSGTSCTTNIKVYIL